MKKKVLSIILGGMLLVGSSVSTLAGEKSYSGYTLYGGYQNNYTSFNSKDTDDDYISNRITDLSGTDTATFWACDKYTDNQYDVHRKISGTYDYTTDDEGDDAQDLDFKSKYDKDEDDKVALGMEDGEGHKTAVGKVSGYCDFR